MTTQQQITALQNTLAIAAAEVNSAVTQAAALTPDTPPPSPGMSPPPGYTAAQMIFEDSFPGTALNTSHWVTYLGANGGIWNNFGKYGPGESGPNTPAQNNAEYYDPSQVVVNNGLTLTAVRSAKYAGMGLSWVSGIVTTEGKFSLPASGWWTQVKAQMPDSTQGMWPAIWFMPDTSSSTVPEFDGYEGGWPGGNATGHSMYFGNSLQGVWNAGVDLSAGYHIYGYHYVPGQSVTCYLDGRQVWQDLTAVTAGTYQLMLELQVAAAGASGWHTVPTASSPGGSMKVAEVQVYA
jgi:hypothetical protein